MNTSPSVTEFIPTTKTVTPNGLLFSRLSCYIETHSLEIKVGDELTMSMFIPYQSGKRDEDTPSINYVITNLTKEDLEALRTQYDGVMIHTEDDLNTFLDFYRFLSV